MSGVSISIASYLCKDIVALSDFYAEIFGFEEVMDLRSEIFRGLDADGVTVGFSALEAYGMLGIDDWANPTGTAQYLTFEVSSAEEVDERTSKAVSLGATLLHEPYDTYYNARQSVLCDLERNVFRINFFLS